MQSHEFDDALLAFPSLEAALAPPAASARGPIERALAIIHAWRERREARVQLADLDRRLLNDIGLTHEGRRVDWIV